MGEVVVARGEVWWGKAEDEKGRPFLIVSRDGANEVMQRVLVAPVTTRIRSVPSELPLGPEEGLPVDCVAGFDNLRSFPKSMLTRRVGALAPARSHLMCSVAAATLDC